MQNPPSNPIWITIVVVTAVLMVIFLLFYGSKPVQIEAPATPTEANSSAKPETSLPK